jgi:DNA ligase-1
MRPSPSQSATLFAKGKKSLGNDGSMWEVVLTSAGVKRWMRVKAHKSTPKRKTPPKRKSTTKRKTPPKRKSTVKRKTPQKRKTPRKRKSTAKRKTPPKRKSTPQRRSSPKRSSPRKQNSPKRKSSQRARVPSTKYKSPMLAQTYNESIDATGYWVSEKLDGVRSVFHGGKFYSRNNNVFHAPKWFLDEMPQGVMLDGELFTKRGDFQNVMSIVSKNTPLDAEWAKITFYVFDMPLLDAPFEERYTELKRVVANAKTRHLKLVNHTRLKSKGDLEKMHKTLAAKGAEGLMLRAPGSYYESRRSKSLLKYKKFRDDEVRVEGHEFGTGKYANVMGKLTVSWKRGGKKVTFKVGSGFNETQRKNYKKLFPVGTFVKIKYFETTSSQKPRFPVFLGVRDKRDMK